jgi:predicted heme/steroid binding protein
MASSFCLSLVAVLLASALSEGPEDNLSTDVKGGPSEQDHDEVEIQAEELRELEKRVFSMEELAQHDGSDESKPLYMAVKGTVFDVTSARDFYGRGSEYNFMTGRDVSHGIAKWSFDPKDHHDSLEGLTKEELEELDNIYKNVYLIKYPIVGITEKYAKMEQKDAVHDDL